MDSYELTSGRQSEQRGIEVHKDSCLAEGSSGCGTGASQSPTWRQVFLAPWIGVLRPRSSIRILVCASTLATLATVFFLVVVQSLIALSLRLWVALLESGSNIGEVFRYSVSEVLQLWHRDGLFGTAERVVMWTSGLSLVALVIVPWLCFPRLYMGGGIWATFWKTFRACLSCAGLAVVLATLVGGTLALTSRIATLSWVVLGRYDGVITGFEIAIFAICAAYFLVLRVIGVVDVIREPVPAGGSPPRCEACGYDLTHQSEGGRCSECGFSIEESLIPGRKRSGCDWERRGGVAAWFRTTYEVLVKTEAFYEKLPVRTTDDQARRFARRHYVLLGLLGSFFMFLGWSVADNIGFVVGLSLVVALLWPLIGWMVLHGISTLVIFWWVARGSSMRVYLTRKILSYESAYLTVVGTLFAMLFGSYFRYGDWITKTLGHEFFAKSFGIQAEPLAVVLGIALSTGIWLWRITVGIRSVRWSNS